MLNFSTGAISTHGEAKGRPDLAAEAKIMDWPVPEASKHAAETAMPSEQKTPPDFQAIFARGAERGAADLPGPPSRTTLPSSPEISVDDIDANGVTASDAVAQESAAVENETDADGWMIDSVDAYDLDDLSSVPHAKMERQTVSAQPSQPKLNVIPEPQQGSSNETDMVTGYADEVSADTGEMAEKLLVTQALTHGFKGNAETPGHSHRPEDVPPALAAAMPLANPVVAHGTRQDVVIPSPEAKAAGVMSVPAQATGSNSIRTPVTGDVRHAAAPAASPRPEVIASIQQSAAQSAGHPPVASGLVPGDIDAMPPQNASRQLADGIDRTGPIDATQDKPPAQPPKSAPAMSIMQNSINGPPVADQAEGERASLPSQMGGVHPVPATQATQDGGIAPQKAPDAAGQPREHPAQPSERMTAATPTTDYSPLKASVLERTGHGAAQGLDPKSQSPAIPQDTGRIGRRLGDLSHTDIAHKDYRPVLSGLSITAGGQATAPTFSIAHTMVGQPEDADGHRIGWQPETLSFVGPASSGEGAIARGAPDPLPPLPDLPRHLARQIANALMAGPERVAELTLSPAELGKVRISLVTGETGVIVTILADRHETLELMRRHADLLAQDFSDIGFGSAEFQFGQNLAGQTQRDEQSARTDGLKDPDILQSEGASEAMQNVSRAVIDLDHLDIRL